MSDDESFHMQLCSDFRAAFLKCFVDFGVGDFQWVILKVEKERVIGFILFGLWSSWWSVLMECSIDGECAFSEEQCKFFRVMASVTELAEECGDDIFVVDGIAIL